MHLENVIFVIFPKTDELIQNADYCGTLARDWIYVSLVLQCLCCHPRYICHALLGFSFLICKVKIIILYRLC
jgi:hypothetical protein